jgi:hypothetical protein
VPWQHHHSSTRETLPHVPDAENTSQCSRHVLVLQASLFGSFLRLAGCNLATGVSEFVGISRFSFVSADNSLGLPEIPSSGFCSS